MRNCDFSLSWLLCTVVAATSVLLVYLGLTHWGGQQLMEAWLKQAASSLPPPAQRRHPSPSCCAAICHCEADCMRRGHRRRLLIPSTTLFAALLLFTVVTWQSASFRHPASSRKASPFKPSNAASLTPDSTLSRISARLRQLETTPIVSYRESLRLNERTCAGRESQSNPDQINGQSNYWRSLSSETLYEKRQNVIDGVRREFGLPGLLSTADMDVLQSPMYGSGTRGIVYTGGNAVCLSG